MVVYIASLKYFGTDSDSCTDNFTSRKQFYSQNRSTTVHPMIWYTPMSHALVILTIILILTLESVTVSHQRLYVSNKFLCVFEQT